MRRKPWVVGLVALALGGCQVMPTRSPPPPVHVDNPANDRELDAAMLMADTFQTMERLQKAQPAEQAEIVSAAREAFQRNPHGTTQLRYALLLATPGHPARNAMMAQVLLRELIAQPDSLVPLERAVVMVELAQLDRELDLTSDNEHLQATQLLERQQRSAAEEHRLQTEVEENSKLRKELAEAQAKLDEIAKIERNLTERKTGSEAATGVHPP
jgi:hypothetical protein